MKSEVSFEENVSYLGVGGNVRLRNAKAELVVACSYGPRIIRYARRKGNNVFAEIPPSEQRVKTPFGDDWHIYGGHRLWHAPEDPVRTYWPDNQAVKYRWDGAALVVTQAVEPHTGLEKELSIALDPASSRVIVTHRIGNRGYASVTLAVWALSAMRPGGRAVFPNAPYVPHPQGLLPAYPLVLWPYTRLHDPRWVWGDRYFQLRQDPSQKEPQKAGYFNREGWVAYVSREDLFVKRYRWHPGDHADFGCNTETFVNEAMLELETLSPLMTLLPGEIGEHTEEWTLSPGIEVSENEEALHQALQAAGLSGPTSGE